MTRGWSVWLLAALMCGCSDDVATGTGAGQADAIAVSDALVSDAATGAAIDIQGEVTATGLPAWLTGTWLECGGDLTITPAGLATWHAAVGSCSATSQLQWQNGVLTFTNVAADQCPNGAPTWFVGGGQASFDGVLLTLVNPKFFAGLKRFSAKPTRESWAFTAKTGGVGTMRLCFDENGQFYDGSWSSSNCSLLACGSIVAQVKHVGTETHVWTECQGSCPCTSIVIATTKTATAMSGTYAGGNCLGAENGTFNAVAQPFKN